MSAGEKTRPEQRLHLPRLTGRQWVQTILGLALAAALLIWGLPFFAKTSWGEVFAVLGTVRWWQVLTFQGLMLAGLYGYTFTITGALPGLSHPRALILNLCGSSVSNLLPAGGAVGLAATYGIARSWGFSNRDTSTMAIVTGVWNLLARIALPVVALGVLWIDGTGLHTSLKEAAVGGALAGGSVLVVFVALIASEGFAQAFGRFLSATVGRLFRRRGTMPIETLVTDLRARIGDRVRHAWWSMTLGMIAFFGLYYLLFWAIMHAAGLRMPLAVLFAAFAIGRLLTAVGVTPGGLGVTETASVAALVAWGAPHTEAMAGVVLFSIFTHLMEVPLGALGWVLWSASAKTAPPPEGSDPSTPTPA